MLGGTKVSGRNDIALLVELDGETVSNFKLREFENAEGLAMVHSSVLYALEQVRRDLGIVFGETVWIYITNGVRTEADNARLGASLGWSDEGGLVSRNSRHLARYGGIAVDLIAVLARNRTRVPQEVVGKICRRYFDWVKDDYQDGHVHADNRNAISETTQ